MTAKDLERFLAKVKINEATRCWEWQAYCNQDGYGKFYVSGKVSYAHRVSYAHTKANLMIYVSYINAMHLAAVTLIIYS